MGSTKVLPIIFFVLMEDVLSSLLAYLSLLEVFLAEGVVVT